MSHLQAKVTRLPVGGGPFGIGLSHQILGYEASRGATQGRNLNLRVICFCGCIKPEHPIKGERGGHVCDDDVDGMWHDGHDGELLLNPYFRYDIVPAGRVSGRPRSENAMEAFLVSAFDLLVTKGFAGFTIVSVATAARAGKTTISLWWPTKAELAVDAFFHRTDYDLRFPNTGIAEDDFRAQIELQAELLADHVGSALAEILGAARTDKTLNGQ